MGLLVKDSALKQTKALPNGAATIYSTGFDLGHGTAGDVLANFELKLTAPALNTSQLPDTRTFTYSIEHDTASNFGTTATIPGFASVLVQTGAGGAGAATASVTVRLPVDVKRYVRIKCVGGTSAGDATATSLTEELLF